MLSDLARTKLSVLLVDDDALIRDCLVRAVLINGADIPDSVLAPSDRYLRKSFSGHVLIQLVMEVVGSGRHAAILKPLATSLHNPDDLRLP